MPDDTADEIALRNQLSTLVRNERNAFTIEQVAVLLAFGKARCESPGLETQDEYRKVLREGYAMAVAQYRELARHEDCTEDEAVWLEIASDIVEGKAP